MNAEIDGTLEKETSKGKAEVESMLEVVVTEGGEKFKRIQSR